MIRAARCALIVWAVAELIGVESSATAGECRLSDAHVWSGVVFGIPNGLKGQNITEGRMSNSSEGFIRDAPAQSIIFGMINDTVVHEYHGLTMSRIEKFREKQIWSYWGFPGFWDQAAAITSSWDDNVIHSNKIGVISSDSVSFNCERYVMCRLFSRIHDIDLEVDTGIFFKRPEQTGAYSRQPRPLGKLESFVSLMNSPSTDENEKYSGDGRPAVRASYWYATFLLALGFVATAAIGPCHSLLPPKVGWPLSLVCLLVGFLLFLHGFDVGWPAP